MRNFEERLAEIGRRSEQIRKKRIMCNRVLALCIPLVLCLAMPLLAALYRSEPTAGTPENMAGGIKTEYHFETMAAAGLPLAVREIRVEGCGQTVSHKETAKLMAVMELLSKLTAPEPETGMESDPTSPYTYAQGGGGAYTAELDPQNTIYRISVVSETGTKEYLLKGSALVSLQNGGIWSLTEQEIFDLKDALGIPRYS